MTLYASNLHSVVIIVISEETTDINFFFFDFLFFFLGGFFSGGFTSTSSGSSGGGGGGNVGEEIRDVLSSKSLGEETGPVGLNFVSGSGDNLVKFLFLLKS